MSARDVTSAPATQPGTPRIGLVARGDRATNTPSDRAATLMTPVIEAFRAAGAHAEHVVYDDPHADDVRAQLRSLDGALVWVNPIQDGATRATLDALLRDVSQAGVWVSAHPDTILAMGTKEVLYRTRHLTWSAGTDLYRTAAELRERFPARLATGHRVLKQGRGTGGQGVWSVTLLDPHTQVVRVEHALARGDGEVEQLPLADFFRRCEDYFAWSGCIVDQPYHPRLGDGMIRCYLSLDEVVGFCHQYPRALLDDAASHPTRPSSDMVGSDAPEFAPLRAAMREWVPQLQAALNLDRHQLPALWDADFFLGDPTNPSRDGYTLCEINVSAVWPFPQTAIEPMVRATLESIRAPRPAKAPEQSSVLIVRPASDTSATTTPPVSEAPTDRAPIDKAIAKARKTKGLIIVNTGDGKGKSTAAFGLLTRAWGHGLRVAVVQFIKTGKARFGEQKAAAKMGIEWDATGDGFTWTSDNMDETVALARHGWELAKQRITSGKYDVIVLDEFTYVMRYGWVDTQEVIDWLRANKPRMLHLVITGRDVPEEFVAFADLVTEMRLVKHPWAEQQVRAQRGVEF